MTGKKIEQHFQKCTKQHTSTHKGTGPTQKQISTCKVRNACYGKKEKNNTKLITATFPNTYMESEETRLRKVASTSWEVSLTPWLTAP